MDASASKEIEEFAEIAVTGEEPRDQDIGIEDNPNHLVDYLDLFFGGVRREAVTLALICCVVSLARPL